jgi:protocatechuate 3,4-dioxygenase beta subunit
MRRIIFSLLVVCTCASAAFAAPAQCTPSLRVAPTNYPGASAIPSGNNLLQPGGKSTVAPGQKLVIVGHVYDKSCLPVGDATVELWQADPFGHWVLAEGDDLAAANAAFAGAGRAVTDENGQFVFITAFPAAVGKHAPSLNFKIITDNGVEFSTAVYFAGDGRNDADPAYKKIPAAARDSATLHMGEVKAGDKGDLAGSINFVLPAKAGYLSY